MKIYTCYDKEAKCWVGHAVVYSRGETKKGAVEGIKSAVRLVAKQFKIEKTKD